MSFGLTFLGDIVVGSVCFVAGMFLKDKVNAVISSTIAKIKAAVSAVVSIFKAKA